MNRKLLCVCTLVMVLLGSVPFGFSQSHRANTLQGLQAIRVLVEELRPGARGTGLTPEQIQTDVELQLRKVGIRIDKSVSEYLYVNANIVELESIDAYVYSLNLEVNQPVTLARDSSIFTTAGDLPPRTSPPSKLDLGPFQVHSTG